MVEIRVRAKQTGCLLLAAVLLLTSVHCILLVLFFRSDGPELFSLIRRFDLDIEGNIPSLYSSGAILICSFLCAVIACLEKGAGDTDSTDSTDRSDRSGRCCWTGLALVFLFLSMDEWFALHENIGDLTEQYVHATGLLYFPWVVPYSILTIIFVLLYGRFVLRLPPGTARLFILSGALYLGGAVGLDMLGGSAAERHGFDSALYCTLYTAEEFLEMSAVVLLIYALLAYMERRFGQICITLQVRKTKQTALP